MTLGQTRGCPRVKPSQTVYVFASKHRKYKLFPLVNRRVVPELSRLSKSLCVQSLCAFFLPYFKPDQCQFFFTPELKLRTILKLCSLYICFPHESYLGLSNSSFNADPCDRDRSPAMPGLARQEHKLLRLRWPDSREPS